MLPFSIDLNRLPCGLVVWHTKKYFFENRNVLVTNVFTTLFSSKRIHYKVKTNSQPIEGIRYYKLGVDVSETLVGVSTEIGLLGCNKCRFQT